MAYTDINSEDRLVQATFAEHLEKVLGWESVYAWNQETFGPEGMLGRASEREVVLVRDLRAALTRLNPELPETAVNEAIIKLAHHDFSRSLTQHNQGFYKLIRDGVPVSYRDAQGNLRHGQARVIDFGKVTNNRFVAVRELKITGLRTPNYNRRADLVCFVNGLPLVFIELKAVYKNIRAGFEGNLRDYLDENVIAHAFHHNAFLIVSNGDNARYGSITSTWEHFGEWKRLDERDKGSVAAEVLLNGMLAKDRLLDIVENFILFDASKAGSTRKVSKVITSNKNGFEHEAALVKLALGLIDFSAKRHDVLSLSPNDIDVEADHHGNWMELWRPEVTKITCALPMRRNSAKDPRFSMPQWIRRDSPDTAVIYWIGSILRAAAIGGNDFTGNRWKTGSTQSYKGLRTGWYKRRMGMMHSAESLVGEYATVSNWFTELLMTCLQWPGFEATHIQYTELSAIDDLATLRAALKSRLEKLDQLCCRTSEMPTLVTSVKRPRGRLAGGFRIVTVQQILPRSKDFTKADPTLSNTRARSDDRDHLSRISLLTYRTLVAKLKADNDDSKVGADLIVFPEVAVHPDDQDILKRLADKTKAIIFAGLIFQDHEEKLVNVARWFIPDYRLTGRRWIIRDQGKRHMTAPETALGISGHRPCQHIIEIVGDKEGPFKLSGAICYDATDLKLAADLKGKTDLFIVCAHNRDVATFDTMASALNYHMYQHVALVNKGEFGGTTIQAPYREHFDRLISHAHGSDQISINVADLDLAAFRRDHRTHKPVKKRPAGMNNIELDAE